MPRSTVLPGGWPGALLVVLLTLGLVGCARTLEAAPAAPAEVHPSWPGCTATGAFDDPDQLTGPPAPGRIPEDFVPAGVVLCERGERTRADGAVLRVGLERRASEITPLLSHLARPSEVSSRPDDLVCPAMAVLPVWLFLTDADGRWVTPVLPTDACGFPLGTSGPSGPALPELAYRDTVVRQLGVQESAEARGSGCAMRWKLLTEEEGSQARPAGIRSDPFGEADVRLCRYAVPEEEQTSSPPSGELLGGQVLDRRQRARLADGLVGAPAASGPCDERASSFAVVMATDGDPVLQVELDGCRRILHPEDGSGTAALAQADAAFVRLLGSWAR